MKALPPASPELVFIKTLGCYEHCMDVAIDHIKFMHSIGRTNFGILTLPYRHGAFWVAVIGMDKEDNKPCFWCNTRPLDVPSDLSPHATYCPHSRPYFPRNIWEEDLSKIDSVGNSLP